MAKQIKIYPKTISFVFLLITFNCFSMKNHVTKIEISEKKPSQIYDFMFELNKEKYISWHPSEHKDFRIVKEMPNIIGSVFYYHEQIGKISVKYNWEVVELIPNQKIIMKAKYFIPVYLVLTFNETQNGTLVTHDLQIGFKNNGIRFVDGIIQSFVFTKSKQNSLTRHANEEFKNLEQLIK